MPATLTITSTDLPTVAPGGQIKSAQWNSSIGVFRGNLLPVDASSSAAANNAYDIGSTGYQWKDAYIAGAVYKSGTETFAYGGYQAFTASGTWSKPTGCRAILVQVYAPGGGGGWADGTAAAYACAGGASGGNYAEAFLTSGAFGVSQSVTCGAVGAGDTTINGTGGTGGQTSFGALVVANGGIGGTTDSVATITVDVEPGGDTAATGTGQFHSFGCPGEQGLSIGGTLGISLNGGGGKAGGPLGGAGGNKSTGNIPGDPGQFPGGGGSGASTASSATDRNGGDGGGSLVIVHQFF